jgi:dihydrofolate reductase
VPEDQSDVDVPGTQHLQALGRMGIDEVQLDASPAEALKTAREAAGGQDVRIGGGPTIIREFLAAGLIDHMHIALVPILLGRGVRPPLGRTGEGVEKDYQVEATSSPSGVTHVTFTRTGR